MHSPAAQRLEHLLSARIERAEPRRGGYSTARCWTVWLSDGRRVFAKCGDDAEVREGIRVEALALSGAVPSMPELLAVADDFSLLVTEDLSDHDWSSPDEDLEAFWTAVAALGSFTPPAELHQAHQGAGRDPWTEVLADPRFAFATGLDAKWLDASASQLVSSALAADTSGDTLLHGDLAPGNWCRRPDGAWRFVDWAGAFRGSPLLDDATAAMRLTRVRRRPTASSRLIANPAILSLVVGRASRELLNLSWTTSPPTARSDRIADVHAGLTVIADLLGLPPPAARNPPGSS